jgi:hypothetical protein
MERVDEVHEHHPEACRRCGTLLQGEDPEPLRHQVIEIPPITPVVIEHRLHRLLCPCCGTSTCADLSADVEPSRYGPRLSALVGLLGSAFPYSFGEASRLCATSQMFNLNTDATGSRMGVWPPGAGLQGQAPNHPMLLRLNGVVVSDGGKGGLNPSGE